MIDYKDGKIYKIVGGGKTYYGSTCVKNLSTRLAQHYHEQTKILKNGGGNRCSSQEILNCDDCQIILVETYPCNSKDELRKREGEYIQGNECINKYIAGRSKKQYSEDNKEYFAKLSKEYRVKNRERIQKQRANSYQSKKEEIKVKQMTKVLCECGTMSPYGHLARHKKTEKHLKLLNKLKNL